MIVWAKKCANLWRAELIPYFLATRFKCSA
ncbi:hypothetical protein CBM2623_A60033 [Cupriavidus taiwanensis]|nr:hypothetical protein CBM2588_A40095 [Cupriavidus taiwanensis]SOZ61320.1 hypothetical protein CBM2617_A40064 [Cupriavidus taiwanensis]SOZ81405.1 hypothetical protein CBM2618_A50065 [Cupriavidus taiwanensis]SOZ82544.1 hypothetical protein CBM2622_A50068 [Cupriavidus taiwanensis]SOZ90989.1 hypothetical protein CBM2621_A50063 [Cupriavidus taiwanensis]